MECIEFAGQKEGKLTCQQCQDEVRESKGSWECDCRTCSADNKPVQEALFALQVKDAFESLQKKKDGKTSANQSVTMLAHAAARAMLPADFDLPHRFFELQSLPEPSEKPITVAKPKRRKYVKKSARKVSATEKGAADKKLKSEPDSSPRRLVSKVEQVEYASRRPFESDVEEEVFVPSCSRLTPYYPTKKQFSGASKRLMQMGKDSSSNEADDKSLPFESSGRTPTSTQASRKRTREPERVLENKSISRATRANQRRLKKGVAALGASGLRLDSLADREQQLRFDRSSIHAWGVFADEDINAGDMVVEYRGELIGNAVAEKREIEYEKAKIGSDYMFRIDGFLVCDATKQGNVARFINASCDPNCYTQIITLNGNKRIVIYAKRDIKAGEELCYDYKFPFEHDEAKRIPCQCGAQDCRGFMNWDKKYVSLPPSSSNIGAGQENAS
jgi:histone-lysine N-methyltransferase SETD1